MREGCTLHHLAVVLTAVTLFGCNGLRLGSLIANRAHLSSDAPDQVQRSPNTPFPAPLTRDGWNAALAPQPPIDAKVGRRWRHPDLELLLRLPPDERPNLAIALTSRDAVVATNAAICLARDGDARGRERLLGTINNKDSRLQIRCAAAEALSELHDPSPVADLRELIDHYQDSTSLSYQPLLHAELLYGLAAHVDAGGDERFSQAVKSAAAEVRLAAVRGWLRSANTPLAEQAADLRTDPDYRVRGAAITAMAVRRHPLALDAARGALADHRQEVRLAAIAALGKIGSADAQRSLEQLEREPELIHAAAIQALAELAARDPVWAGAESQSWHVRQAVAAALVHWPDAGGAILARRLLADPSIEVQKQVLSTLAEWPLDLSGPVLLEAMAGGGYLSRKTAAMQLAERWPAAREFTADAPPDRRAEILAQLHDTWSQEHPLSPTGLPAEQPTQSEAALPPAAERLERTAQLLRRLQKAAPSGGDAAALRELAQFGPDVPMVLEQLVEERSVVVPDAVYRDVLPKWGGAFELLDRLRSSQVHERRRAARELASFADREPLSALALARLSELSADETDVPVLTNLFQAVADDGRQPAVRLAYAGVGHREAEVRRLAVNYLDAHPAPEHARVLLPALDDDNHAVVLAAVKALGHPGVLDDPAPLQRLLTSTDRQIRLAVAESLIALGAESGPATIELLAHDRDIDTRRQSAQIMGRHPDPRYAETLIGLLDDTLGVRTAALASLPLVVGRDLAQRPDDPPTSTLDRVERWKKWWTNEGRLPP